MAIVTSLVIHNSYGQETDERGSIRQTNADGRRDKKTAN